MTPLTDWIIKDHEINSLMSHTPKVHTQEGILFKWNHRPYRAVTRKGWLEVRSATGRLVGVRKPQ